MITHDQCAFFCGLDFKKRSFLLVLGKLGPGAQLSAPKNGQLVPGQLGPGAHLSNFLGPIVRFLGLTFGPWGPTVWGPICLEPFPYLFQSLFRLLVVTFTNNSPFTPFHWKFFADLETIMLTIWQFSPLANFLGRTVLCYHMARLE